MEVPDGELNGKFLNNFCRVGCAIMTTIVATERTKANSVIRSTRHARRKSSPVKTSSAFDRNIVVTTRTTVATIQTKWAARRRRTALALPDNSLARMVNVLIIIWFATKWPTAQTSLTSRCIATLTNVPRLRFINVVTNAWTL